MYRLLVKLMLIAALAQLGMGLSEVRDCHGRECMVKLYAASLKVLDIDWKPISVFPEEAKRFR